MDETKPVIIVEMFENMVQEVHSTVAGIDVILVERRPGQAEEPTLEWDGAEVYAFRQITASIEQSLVDELLTKVIEQEEEDEEEDKVEVCPHCGRPMDGQFDPDDECSCD